MVRWVSVLMLVLVASRAQGVSCQCVVSNWNVTYHVTVQDNLSWNVNGICYVSLIPPVGHSFQLQIRQVTKEDTYDPVTHTITNGTTTYGTPTNVNAYGPGALNNVPGSALGSVGLWVYGAGTYVRRTGYYQWRLTKIYCDCNPTGGPVTDWADCSTACTYHGTGFPG